MSMNKPLCVLTLLTTGCLPRPLSQTLQAADRSLVVSQRTAFAATEAEASLHPTSAQCVLEKGEYPIAGADAVSGTLLFVKLAPSVELRTATGGKCTLKEGFVMKFAALVRGQSRPQQTSGGAISEGFPVEVTVRNPDRNSAPVLGTERGTFFKQNINGSGTACAFPDGTVLTVNAVQRVREGHAEADVSRAMLGARDLMAECDLQHGFLYREHFVEKNRLTPPRSAALGRYNEALGRAVANYARNHAGAGSGGLCYTYVGAALENVRFDGRQVWARGFHDDESCNAVDLNCAQAAKNFAMRWNSSVHEAGIRYTPVFLRNNLNGESVDLGVTPETAPVGSILVWEKCSERTEGHIAIVTEEGKQAASDFSHTVNLCGNGTLIGIFIPVL